MTTERDARILAEHHEIAGGRIAEAARDASPVPAELATPALDLDAVEARVPDGYDAPWRVEPSESGEWLVAYATDCPQAGLVATVPDYGWTLAEFIAAARSDVPTLTAEVRRLRAVLDAARSTDPGPAPDGIPVDRSGFEVTVVAAENIDRADSGRRVDAKVLASTRAALAYELADLACEYHLVAAKQAIVDREERAPLSSVPPGTEADQ